jgi:hypothetical protein
MSIQEAGELVLDPMDFAEDAAKFYAEGDTGSSEGFGSCSNDGVENNNITHIRCHGTRGILVHGGEMFESEFECEYYFSAAILNKDKGFHYEGESCQ